MKIGLTSDYFYPKTGGAEQSALELCRALVKKGHEVVVFTRGEGSKDSLEGITVNRIFKDLIKYTFKNDVLFPRIADKKESKRLFEYLQNKDFDILHSNNRDTAVFTALVGEKLNIPTITHIRDYWPICPKRDLLKSDGPCPEPKNCAFCMAEYYNKLYNLPFYAKSALDTRYRYREISKYSDYFLYNSRYVKERIALTPGEVIHNPVDIDTIQQGKSKDGKVLFVGNITERKGVKTLVKAVKGLDITLHLIGDGYLSNQIKGENIIKHGRLEYEQVLKHLSDSEMLVVPSTWPEPFGRVAVEGMAAGLPVIVAESGGLPEVIDECGLITKSGDHEDLNKKIVKLHKDEELRKKLSKKGLARSKIFSPQKIAERTLSIYKKLLN
ncbi:MAG: glycosyltransferase family 4 protein [Thermoplasmatota archaeon]